MCNSHANSLPLPCITRSRSQTARTQGGLGTRLHHEVADYRCLHSIPVKLISHTSKFGQITAELLRADMSDDERDASSLLFSRGETEGQRVAVRKLRSAQSRRQLCCSNLLFLLILLMVVAVVVVTIALGLGIGLNTSQENNLPSDPAKRAKALLTEYPGELIELQLYMYLAIVFEW